jgi:hypothetical protein
MIVAIGFVLLAAASVGAQESPKATDPLAPFRVLEGVWQGESEGFGQTSKVTHEWKKVLGGKFIRLKTRSVSKGEDGRESVHEDVGYISWSNDENIPRFRQFLSEGFVNTFRLAEAKEPTRGFNFEPESTEGHRTLVARMTLRFDQARGYEMVLELGNKGKPLKACQTMQLKKVR